MKAHPEKETLTFRVTTWVGSDTATYLRGRHVLKFGGEYRRATVSPFTLDPGTFTFPDVAAFQAGFGNGFNITLGDRASDLIVPAVGLFVFRHGGRFENGVATDTWTVVPGSGTSGLRGITGQVEFSAGHQARYEIIFEFEIPDSA